MENKTIRYEDALNQVLNTNALTLVTDNVAKSKIIPNFRVRTFEKIGQIFNYVTLNTNFDVVYEFHKASNLTQRKHIGDSFFVRMYVIDKTSKEYYILSLLIKKTDKGLELYDVVTSGISDNEKGLTMKINGNGTITLTRLVETSLELPLYNS